MRQRRARSATVVLALIVSVGAGLASGCAGSPDAPRKRVGALPFPGAFTLYHAADPDKLGVHRYERTPRWFRADEAERGILYTTRAGFLDVAHLRVTIDSVRYGADRVRAALRDGRDTVYLTTLEGSTFIVTLRPPPPPAPSVPDASDETAADDEAHFFDELSIRTGQRLAYLMMTWHEVATWFGYRTIAFIDESPSAFTYDDAMSHVVGLRVAGRALRDRSGRSFDEAVTAALREELAELGAVSRERTDQAARAVEGTWWSRGKPLRRQLDVGLTDNAVRPWLVSRFAFAPETTDVEPFALPTLDDVLGRDCSHFCYVRIDPNIPEGDRMRQLLPDRPRRFDAERDLPLLVEATRRQMRQRLAADVDRPWPMHLATTRPAGEPNVGAGG